jgi:hypothetical protein
MVELRATNVSVNETLDVQSLYKLRLEFFHIRKRDSVVRTNKYKIETKKIQVAMWTLALTQVVLRDTG